nr:hypothetical protein BHI3_20690 [Bacteriovorax sp. HI3]
MKLFLALMLLSTTAMAEVFKLPAGITFRAKGVGYDCGEFFTEYKPAPKKYADQKITFLQLAADKDLNTFLVEGTFPGTDGGLCTFGLFLNRSRDTKSMEIDHTEVVSTGNVEACFETKNWIDDNMSSMKYYASKRGIRFIAFEVMNEENDVCPNNTVRAVFDRR